jgi:hypothetical protein
MARALLKKVSRPLELEVLVSYLFRLTGNARLEPHTTLDSAEALIEESVADSSYLQQELYNTATENDTMDYQKGLLTIGFCTLVFASLSPEQSCTLL